MVEKDSGCKINIIIISSYIILYSKTTSLTNY